MTGIGTGFCRRSALPPCALAMAAAVLLGAACASTMSAESMSEHVADPDPNVRRTIAQSPNASPQVLTTLSTDADDMVRSRVVENPNTPAEVIAKLSEDKAINVIEALSRCPKTPPERLTALAKQFRPGMGGHVFWLNLVDNPGTPADVRLELLGKVVADQDGASGVKPLPAEMTRVVKGTWRFEIAPWTKVELSDPLREDPAGDRARAVLGVVKADKYGLTLAESRAAKLECPSCQTMLGTWNVGGGRVKVEMRSGPVSWRFEGALPTLNSATWELQTSKKPPEGKQSSGRGASTAPASGRPPPVDAAHWTIEMQRAP